MQVYALQDAWVYAQKQAINQDLIIAFNFVQILVLKMDFKTVYEFAFNSASA